MTFEAASETVEQATPIIISSRYQVTGVLGAGRMGTVYEVYDKLWKRKLAMKKLTPTAINKDRMEYRSIDDAAAMLAEARGPLGAVHVVPSFLVQDEAGELFTLMPIYKKRLMDVMHNLSEVDALRYTKEMLLGLKELYDSLQTDWQDEMHSRGIDVAALYILGGKEYFKPSHGDLKPDNMFIADDGRLLIGDKGTASYTSLPNMDNIGALVIRAPELYHKGSQPDEHSDIYSVGVNTYKMLTGEFPFEKELKRDENYVRDMSDETFRKEIDRKIGKTSRRFEEFFDRTLTPHHTSRYDLHSATRAVSRLYEDAVFRMALKEKASGLWRSFLNPKQEYSV